MPGIVDNPKGAKPEGKRRGLAVGWRIMYTRAKIAMICMRKYFDTYIHTCKAYMMWVMSQKNKKMTKKKQSNIIINKQIKKQINARLIFLSLELIHWRDLISV